MRSWLKDLWLFILYAFRLVIILIIFFLLTRNIYACEFGKTYMDNNLNGDGSVPSVEEGIMYENRVYYYRKGLSEPMGEFFFDKNGRIEIATGYTWCGMENPPPKGKCPYVLYKGHRWYPQYHGIIYVYKDGRKVK